MSNIEIFIQKRETKITFYDKIMNLVINSYFLPISSLIWGLIFVIEALIYNFFDKSLPSLVQTTGFTDPVSIVINVTASVYMALGYFIGIYQIKRFHYWGNKGLEEDGTPSSELFKWALNSPLFDIFAVQYGILPIPKSIRIERYLKKSENQEEIAKIVTSCYLYSRYARSLMKKKYWLIFALPLGLAGLSFHIASLIYYTLIDFSVPLYSILDTISSVFIGPGYFFMPFTLAWLVAFTISFKELIRIGTNWTDVSYNYETNAFEIRQISTDESFSFDKDTKIIELKTIVEGYANNSIINLRTATKPVAATYFQFSLIIILAGFIFGTFLGSNPEFWYVGLIPAVIAAVLGLLVFLLPQIYIHRVLSSQKHILLTVIEHFYQIRLNTFLKYHNAPQRPFDPEDLNLLSSASERVSKILEWPFDYSTLAALFASAAFPIVSLVGGQLIDFKTILSAFGI